MGKRPIGKIPAMRIIPEANQDVIFEIGYQKVVIDLNSERPLFCGICVWPDKETGEWVIERECIDRKQKRYEWEEIFRFDGQESSK